MRARYPDADGIVVRDGVEIRYERYGEGWPPILLLPTWSLVHSRHWKMQVPYLARHFTVVCFDGRGSGGSGRPASASAGHFPQARDPVRVNLLIKQFADRVRR